MWRVSKKLAAVAEKCALYGLPEPVRTFVTIERADCSVTRSVSEALNRPRRRLRVGLPLGVLKLEPLPGQPLHSLDGLGTVAGPRISYLAGP